MKRLHLNESSFGCSPNVSALFSEIALHRYDDGDGQALKSAIASHHGVTSAQILLFNGSIEALCWMMMGHAKSPFLIPTPCYHGYQALSAHMGLRTTLLPLYELSPGPHFGASKPALLEEALDKGPTSVCLFAEPNNPLGTVLPEGTLAGLAARHPQATFLVDEAYADFASRCAPRADNIVILRTFSKSHGLAALRVGYAIVPEAQVKRLTAFRLTYCLDAIAQRLAIAALADRAWHDATMKRVRTERTRLNAALSSRGHFPSASEANFVCAAVTGDAAALVARLKDRGFLVKASSSNLSHVVRITVGTEEENTALIEALS